MSNKRTTLKQLLAGNISATEAAQLLQDNNPQTTVIRWTNGTYSAAGKPLTEAQALATDGTMIVFSSGQC